MLTKTEIAQPLKTKKTIPIPQTYNKRKIEINISNIFSWM